MKLLKSRVLLNQNYKRVFLSKLNDKDFFKVFEKSKVFFELFKFSGIIETVPIV